VFVDSKAPSGSRRRLPAAGDDAIRLGHHIETAAGTLIALGFLTRPAAFIASGDMAVAYFLTHFPAALLPVQNNGIPAVLFCFAFLYIAAHGAGVFSFLACPRARARSKKLVATASDEGGSRVPQPYMC